MAGTEYGHQGRITTMKKIMLICALLIIFAAAVLIALSTVFINSDRLKTKIVQQIHAQTGLQVVLHGKINWIFAPQLGASFAEVELIEPPIFDQHLSAKSRRVDVFLAWRPLISGQVVINKLMFQQISVSVNKKILQVKMNAVITGDVQIDFPAQQLIIDNLMIDSGGVHATGKISGQKIFQAPELDGQLQIAQLDLGHGLSTVLTNNVIHFQLSPHQPVSGTLTSEHLHLKNQDISQISANFAIDAGKIQLMAIKGALAGGEINGQAVIKDFTSLPRYQIDSTLSHVELSKLLQSGILQGPADIALNLTMNGNTEEALLTSANGTVKLAAKNGILNHIDLLRQIASVRQFLAVNPQTASTADVTHFSELNASGVIKNGLFTNNDFILQSPDLQAKGAGTVNMINKQINYQLAVKAQGKMLNNAYDVSVPLKISGTLDKPQVKIDFGSLTISTQSDSVKKLGKSVHKELKILFGHP